MSAPVPYLFLGGHAREALAFYAAVFGGETEIHTFEAFGRTDGPADAVAHGILTGPVSLFAADTAQGDPTLSVRGIHFSLLGAAEPDVLSSWFSGLADGGAVVDPLQERPWGAHDGTVTDRFGLTWLIGWE
jgi:PhnB protein